MDSPTAIEIVLISEADERKIEVFVGRPLPFPDGTGFYCAVQVRGVGDEKVQQIAGVDSGQALQLAMDTVQARLKELYPEILAKFNQNVGTHRVI